MKKIREFEPADRYLYDFGLCSAKNGFAQVDTEQDASYYGTWANPFKFIIFNYCEGDCTTTICENAEEFKAEMKELESWTERIMSRPARIDCLCKKDLEDAFKEIGLSDMLH